LDRSARKTKQNIIILIKIIEPNKHSLWITCSHKYKIHHNNYVWLYLNIILKHLIIFFATICIQWAMCIFVCRAHIYLDLFRALIKHMLSITWAWAWASHQRNQFTTLTTEGKRWDRRDSSLSCCVQFYVQVSDSMLPRNNIFHEGIIRKFPSYHLNYFYKKCYFHVKRWNINSNIIIIKLWVVGLP